MTHAPLARDLLRRFAARGRSSFSTGEAAHALDRSHAATLTALRRLAAKGEVATPYRDFHVIIPPEYGSLGCLPADQFIPELMAKLGEPYYAGLLSAAQYHGAAHQQPQTFQVVVPRNRRPIICGKVRIEFIARQGMEKVRTVSLNTPRGTVRVSTPEETALDLVGYPRRAAGLSHVATVLVELAETIDPKNLATAAGHAPIAWVQRLGYLLDMLEHGGKSEPIQNFVAGADPDYVRLAPWAKKSGTYDSKWRVIVNTIVEPDEL